MKNKKLGDKRFAGKRRIQAFLDKAGLTQSEFAARIGVSKTTVSRTLFGYLHSPPVLDGLRELGVPEKFLCDPRRATA